MGVKCPGGEFDDCGSGEGDDGADEVLLCRNLT